MGKRWNREPANMPAPSAELNQKEWLPDIAAPRFNIFEELELGPFPTSRG